MKILSQFEDAAREAADELTSPRPLGEENVEDIQLLLKSDANPIQIRDLRVRIGGSISSVLFSFFFVSQFILIKLTRKDNRNVYYCIYQ